MKSVVITGLVAVIAIRLYKRIRYGYKWTQTNTWVTGLDVNQTIRYSNIQANFARGMK